jgi:hypothetical protein
MEYIKETYLEEIEHCDLDLINEDEILGLNKDGHDYQIITEEGEDMWWNGEAQQINIDTLIDTLQEMKKKGANYVELMHHGDHHGYNIYGVELRKATDEEIVIARKKAKEEHEVRMQNKIDELESEIESLKKDK